MILATQWRYNDMTTLYYTLKQTHDNKYFINDLQVDYKTFDKIFLNTDKYKQINQKMNLDQEFDINTPIESDERTLKDSVNEWKHYLKINILQMVLIFQSLFSFYFLFFSFEMIYKYKY